ncbi:hypothetical protein BO94DRAFT_64203 [Aspergillus sclerotioniger CBS 115572]|uniref:Uncharacterized protein n=1 Tax=Aspergillus sclerotioniger CBS 115572 TaxID=1450535 RepID=A0A317WRZ3_9EURO|nr:hypothetical protein BO94DRAFT_64203 [Aspergillus sclerotioniger CBS 115572]PWY88082.1 hypothetical protein BO94DRAFT_64203 [Aspergillus sclerotioniger CBS 115572]
MARCSFHQGMYYYTPEYISYAQQHIQLHQHSILPHPHPHPHQQPPPLQIKPTIHPQMRYHYTDQHHHHYHHPSTQQTQPQPQSHSQKNTPHQITMTHHLKIKTRVLENTLHQRRYEHALLREGLRRGISIAEILRRLTYRRDVYLDGSVVSRDGWVGMGGEVRGYISPSVVAAAAAAAAGEKEECRDGGRFGRKRRVEVQLDDSFLRRGYKRRRVREGEKKRDGVVWMH